MSWKDLQVSACGTFHHHASGEAAYAGRYDEVLKFHAPGLAPVRTGADAWHICPDGSAAYARRFSRTFGYYEGAAAVVSDDRWHHIDTEGRDLYPQRYDWCGNFQHGRCTVRQLDGRYSHIDANGSDAYEARWRYAGDFRDGVAVVQRDDGRSTHIDPDGNFLHGRWFLDLDVFHKGFARARDEGGWMHVDRQGEPIYRSRYANVEPFYNGQARVERDDGSLAVIDELGQTLVQLREPLESAFAVLSRDMVGFWRTQTIATAVELGLPDRMPAPAAGMAADLLLDVDRMTRLLRALAELGLAREQAGIWSLSERGSFLRSDHPLTLADAALEYAHHFPAMWRRLSQAVRGDSSWCTPDVFGEVAQDARRRSAHHRMLRSYARHDYADVVGVLELDGTERIIDAAGGLGVLGELMLKSFPGLSVLVLERPEVVEQANSSIPGMAWKAQDLFLPWEEQADVVMLSRVLHDWEDGAAKCILANARSALSLGGKVLIIEMLLNEKGYGGSLCDLHLLAVTGGRERSLAEYRHLIESEGFTLRQVLKTEGLCQVLVAEAL